MVAVGSTQLAEGRLRRPKAFDALNAKCGFGWPIRLAHPFLQRPVLSPYYRSRDPAVSIGYELLLLFRLAHVSPVSRDIA